MAEKTTSGDQAGGDKYDKWRQLGSMQPSETPPTVTPAGAPSGDVKIVPAPTEEKAGREWFDAVGLSQPLHGPNDAPQSNPQSATDSQPLPPELPGDPSIGDA